MGPFTTLRLRPLLLALVATVVCAGVAVAGVATEVAVDKSILMNLEKPSERVSIANPAIAELVVISPTQLQINGKKVGSTSIIVWDKGGKTAFFDVRVKGDTAHLEELIQEIAPNDSITVDYANDTIILRGKAKNEATVAKAVKLAQAYVAKIAEEHSYKNEQSGMPQMGNQVSAFSGYGNGLNVLGGSSQYMREVNDIYESGLGSGKMIHPEDRVLNYIEIEEPQQVLLEVKVAQVDKSAMKELGLSWFARGNSAEGFSNLVGAPSGELTITDPVTGQTISKAEGIAATHPGLAQITPLNPYQLGVSLFEPGIGAVLKALATKNMAKILAEPNLLVKSGQEGRFLAGQKYPISVLTAANGIATTSIFYENVGIKLNFKPRVQENGLIFLKIDPAEVSVISGFLPTSGYPIIDTKETHTSVQLKDGESLILSGLLKEESIKAMSKIPILGDMPILGALFRTTKDDLKETELVFFITPRLVNPKAPGSKTELPTDRRLTPEQEKEFRWFPSVD